MGGRAMVGLHRKGEREGEGGKLKTIILVSAGGEKTMVGSPEVRGH